MLGLNQEISQEDDGLLIIKEKKRRRDGPLTKVFIRPYLTMLYMSLSFMGVDLHGNVVEVILGGCIKDLTEILIL